MLCYPTKAYDLTLNVERFSSTLQNQFLQAIGKNNSANYVMRDDGFKSYDFEVGITFNQVNIRKLSYTKFGATYIFYIDGWSFI